MAENTGKSSGKNTKTLIIAIIALLLIINGVVYYMDYREKEEMRAEIASKDTELADTYRRLNDMTTELDARIAEIEKLGGNVEELEKAKAELEAEKQQLQRSGEIARRRLNEVNAKVKGYETLLREKDVEITRLRTLSDSLYAENTNLKTTQNQLSDSVRTINQNRQELSKKVAIASRLKAENIKVAAVNKRGKEREGEFRDGQIDKLKVTFNLADNPVAPIESKDILLRVIDPNGNVLFDVATGSGTMMIDGREEFYTAQQNILFDNTRQQLTYMYDKGSEFEEGVYNVELYADGFMIGQEKFRVK
ncbi:chromosome segregation protein SMC [Cesiribacter sp. SM1]|uniref:chromosome segregation protein SMC n=1 Tax=Cesiribacter sp. SM1 TaxID=2861196 RepID=UPI001CD3EB4D|nr:chromosome segregation protein SMC [Cesiribacter sp. SM1]